MKKFIPTLLLVVICLGGFLYAKSQNFFKEKEPEAANQLVTLQEADVQGFTVQGSGEVLQLSKKDDGWDMSKPAAYPIDKFAADGWVTSFAGLTFESKIDENPDNLGEFGLDKPSRQFQVTLKDGSTKTLLVGNPLPVAGSSYAKLDDSPIVYEVKDDSIQALDKAPVDLIDKSVFAVDFEKTSSVSVDWKGENWQATKADSAWKVNGKDATEDQGSSLLSKLAFLSTDEMVKPASEVNVTAPDLKIEVGTDDGGKKTTTQYAGKIDQDFVWIVKQGGAWAYKLPMASIQDLYDAGKEILTPSPSPSPSDSPTAAPTASPSVSPAK